ncbi:hypothetical protein [Desulfoscipio gibsoniae]
MRSRKILPIFLALMLVVALAATPAFANWPSFQKDSSNNGITDVLVTTPSAVYDDLDNNFGGAINAPSVIDNGVSYTLYNGGYVDSTNGGARMQATTLSSGTPVWNEQIDTTANNVAQLSTPVLVGSNLYALTTGSTTLYRSATITPSDWEGTATIDDVSETATFPADDTTYIYTEEADVEFIAPTTNINTRFELTPAVNDAALYTIELFDDSDVHVATLVDEAILYGTFDEALNYYDGPEIPAGDYKLKLTIETDATNAITGVTDISLSGNGWNLYKVATSTGTETLLESGIGAANTPLAHCGDYLYFGIYGGDRDYYQYNISTPALNEFDAGEDFYWAGATVVEVNTTDYAVFGSDSGTVYWREVGDFETAGCEVDLTTHEANAGNVRSSIVAPGDGYLYFTSQGDISSTGNPGYLWKFEEDGTYVDHVDLSGNSTSTPVISDNGFVYVGYYDHGNFQNPNGGVAAYDTSLNFDATIYSGDPVQASPVVCSDGDFDFIYFTTNSSSGAGYCYSYDTILSDVTPEWTAGGTSSNRYALQGFAADGDYLVYGDDGIRLYIIKEAP